MRDAPTGHYVLKLKDKPLNARTFHLYKDCGHIASIDGDEAFLITPTDEIIALMEMRVCTQCKNRSEEVDPEDVIAETLDRYGVVDDTTLAQDVIRSLERHGYKIARVRRGGAG